MAVFEKNVLLACKDSEGNTVLLYPITTLDCVDGAEDLLHHGAQDLNDAEKAQARINIGAIPTPAAAEVGHFLRVAAVDASGKITAVEAVSMAVGSRATVDGDTLVLTNATADGNTVNLS